MVVVMPGLAEARQRESEGIGRMIVGLEAPRAEEVADQVDAPGDVVDEANTAPYFRKGALSLNPPFGGVASVVPG
jgi:hypothetical protein